jgi:hypothetical protein
MGRANQRSGDSREDVEPVLIVDEDPIAGERLRLEVALDRRKVEGLIAGAEP